MDNRKHLWDAPGEVRTRMEFCNEDASRAESPGRRFVASGPMHRIAVVCRTDRSSPDRPYTN